MLGNKNIQEQAKQHWKKIIKFDVFAEFPGKCIAFWGSHSMECVTGMWLELGCLREGLYYPENLDPNQLEIVLNFNLKYVNDNP